MIPANITVEILESGVKLEKENDSLTEINYTSEFQYTLKFTAKIKTSNSGGGSGGDSGGSEGNSGGSNGGAESNVNATNVTFISPFSSVKIESISSDTVRLTGSYFLAFNDYYKFVKKNGEQIILPPDTKEPDIALIQYKMPSPTTRVFEYVFNVTWPADASYDGIPLATQVVIKQESYWNTFSASVYIDKLKELKF